MMSESIITCSSSAYYCKHTNYYVRAVAGEQTMTNAWMDVCF